VLFYAYVKLFLGNENENKIEIELEYVGVLKGTRRRAALPDREFP